MFSYLDAPKRLSLCFLSREAPGYFFALHPYSHFLRIMTATAAMVKTAAMSTM